MAEIQILNLGNPKLYQVCAPLEKNELADLQPIIQDLHDTLTAFRKEQGYARAIAAPQIGVMKRLVYTLIDEEPKLYINPVLFQKSSEMMILWDDCMCFPDLLVKVKRHRSCKITYLDRQWNKKTELLEDELSELMQHECDHLYGILAVSRAIDGQSFAYRGEIENLRGRVVNIR